MASPTTVKQFVDRLSGSDEQVADLQDEEVRLAAAVLLVHATAVDGEVDWRERQLLHNILERGFNLDRAQLGELVAQADEKEKKSVGPDRLTSLLTLKLSKDDRMKVLEMLFEVINADGVIHEHEGKFASRVEQSLGITPNDWARARKNEGSRDA